MRKYYYSYEKLGKTFTTTLDIVLDCLEACAGKRPGTRWVILSR